jgi:hypothetical protein
MEVKGRRLMGAHLQIPAEPRGSATVSSVSNFCIHDSIHILELTIKPTPEFCRSYSMCPNLEGDAPIDDSPETGSPPPSTWSHLNRHPRTGPIAIPQPGRSL